MAISKTANRNILGKITKMINISNEQQRRASASIHCEDLFSSATPYAEELEQNIDLIIQDRDVRQCHFQANNIEPNIVMMKKFIVATRKANMYFNRFVSTKRRSVAS